MNTKKLGHLVNLVMDQNKISMHHFLFSTGLPFDFPDHSCLAGLNIAGVSLLPQKGSSGISLNAAVVPSKRMWEGGE